MKGIRRRSRKQQSAEEKDRIVPEGLRDEDIVAELYRREGIETNLYYKRSREFLKAGKKRLASARHVRRLPLKRMIYAPKRRL